MSAGVPQRHRRIGRYEVTRWLGAGSFASVYLGYDPALDATVALKVLGDHHASTVDIRERFIQEARMLRSLANDRVVTVRDIGEIDGQPYFVMDAYEAGTLADRLQTHTTAPSMSTVRHVVAEIGLCMEAVHAGGLVHRDLKPSNLLIGQTGDRVHDALVHESERLVLGDFGIARYAIATGLTRGAGTHGFMAPEQNAPMTTVDHRADIYAATAIVQLFTRRRWHDDQLPPKVRQALEAGLADEVDARPATAKEWVDLWFGALPDGRTTTSPRPNSSSPKRGRLKARALAAGAGIAVVASLVAVLNQPEGPEIFGPDEIRLGTTAVYSFEAQQDATYSWTDSAGDRHEAPALQITPSSTGSFTVRLDETIADSTRSTTLTVDVVDS